MQSRSFLPGFDPSGPFHLPPQVVFEKPGAMFLPDELEMVAWIKPACGGILCGRQEPAPQAARAAPGAIGRDMGQECGLDPTSHRPAAHQEGVELASFSVLR
ncbi:MAG TPA: hypothetical protein VIJ35_22695, partial [Bradyrhizobium sp.]